MSNKEANLTNVTLDKHSGLCKLKKRWNRIESSSSGRESDESEVIGSSQDFQPLTASARKLVANISRHAIPKRAKQSGKESSDSDLDDLLENPVKTQTKDSGSCSRGQKRMSRLDILYTSSSENKFTFKKRRLALKDAEEDGRGRRGPRQKLVYDDNHEDTQKHLQSLIENDSSDSNDGNAKQSPEEKKKFIKTPSTTIDWNESLEESNPEQTIVFSEESVKTPINYTRITADEISEYFGLKYINCTIDGRKSIVLLRPRQEDVRKNQTLDVELSEKQIRMSDCPVYLVDKYRIIIK
ncbi:uncharacterized protein LOC132261783 [Phlebotomus argentipes]|uniref:uncharacterized protein LOC132261783 n=1 Tax=Phlebotomus argentipes TaxID=94469 RepID=UPI002893156F|nr:uncharacterized protein LOC132261783 [Phlebotomus argentipes]